MSIMDIVATKKSMVKINVKNVKCYHLCYQFFCFFLLMRCVAAEGQMDCVLLLVNMEHSPDIIDSPDTQGQ